MVEARRTPWSALPRRGRQRVPLLALLVLFATQQSCTLLGLGVGVGMSKSEPGPYGERPLSPQARHDPQAFEQLNLSKGERLELVLANGTYLEGEYLQVEPATASDPEMYLLLVPKRENGRRPDDVHTPRHIPFSQVKTLNVEVADYAWIVGGVAVGVALDAFMISLLGRGLSD